MSSSPSSSSSQSPFAGAVGQGRLPTLLAKVTLSPASPEKCAERQAAVRRTRTEFPLLRPPACLRVKNTFFHYAAERSSSLEPFYRERVVQSCPASPAKEDDADVEKAVAKEAVAKAGGVAGDLGAAPPLELPLKKAAGPAVTTAGGGEGDQTGTTACASEGEPDFHCDGEASPCLYDGRPPSPPLVGGDVPGPCPAALAACLGPFSPPFACAIAPGCGYMMYPMMPRFAMCSALVMPPAPAPPRAAVAPPRAAPSNPRVLSLADAVSGAGAGMPANEPAEAQRQRAGAPASSASRAAAPPSAVAPPASSRGAAAAGTVAAPLPSVGSRLHALGTCSPCGFFHTVGCKSGAQCEFCHLCDAEEKKRRRKEKIRTRRLEIARLLEESAAAAKDAEVGAAAETAATSRQ